jgi:ankyrin repeat protein
MHRATLLHYMAASGVERYRQNTPSNAVEIARVLLQAGAEPDALADMYGVECTTMSMLVSSSHPAKAALQVALVEVLLDFGAAIEGRGTRKWGGPLFTGLAFAMSDAAAVLAKRGARIDLPTATGLGLVDDAARMLPSADAEALHRATSRRSTVRQRSCACCSMPARIPIAIIRKAVMLTRPPLHEAVLNGDEAVVRLLVGRSARVDIRDTVWNGTPLGWAIYGGGKAQVAMAECLRSLGAAE